MRPQLHDRGGLAQVMIGGLKRIHAEAGVDAGRIRKNFDKIFRRG